MSRAAARCPSRPSFSQRAMPLFSKLSKIERSLSAPRLRLNSSCISRMDMPAAPARFRLRRTTAAWSYSLTTGSKMWRAEFRAVPPQRQCRGEVLSTDRRRAIEQGIEQRQPHHLRLCARCGGAKQTGRFRRQLRVDRPPHGGRLGGSFHAAHGPRKHNCFTGWLARGARALPAAMGPRRAPLCCAARIRTGTCSQIR